MAFKSKVSATFEIGLKDHFNDLKHRDTFAYYNTVSPVEERFCPRKLVLT